MYNKGSFDYNIKMKKKWIFTLKMAIQKKLFRYNREIPWIATRRGKNWHIFQLYLFLIYIWEKKIMTSLSGQFKSLSDIFPLIDRGPIVQVRTNQMGLLLRSVHTFSGWEFNAAGDDSMQMPLGNSVCASKRDSVRVQADHLFRGWRKKRRRG